VLRKCTLDFAITVDFEVWRFWLQSEHCLCLILVRSSHLISHAICNTNRETLSWSRLSIRGYPTTPQLIGFAVFCCICMALLTCRN
jgi:hypothetical protein